MISSTLEDPPIWGPLQQGNPDASLWSLALALSLWSPDRPASSSPADLGQNLPLTAHAGLAAPGLHTAGVPISPQAGVVPPLDAIAPLYGAMRGAGERAATAAPQHVVSARVYGLARVCQASLQAQYGCACTLANSSRLLHAMSQTASRPFFAHRLPGTLFLVTVYTSGRYILEQPSPKQCSCTALQRTVNVPRHKGTQPQQK